VDLNKAIAIAATILVLGLVGTADYEEEKRSNEFYCKMVAEGTWPNFNPETQCDTESGSNE
jgi:hypothetical protein